MCCNLISFRVTVKKARWVLTLATGKMIFYSCSRCSDQCVPIKRAFWTQGRVVCTQQQRGRRGTLLTNAISPMQSEGKKVSRRVTSIPACTCVNQKLLSPQGLCSSEGEERKKKERKEKKNPLLTWSRSWEPSSKTIRIRQCCWSPRKCCATPGESDPAPTTSQQPTTGLISFIDE
jgi:hypothetical protein